MEERKTGYSQDDVDELKAFFKKNDITRFATLDKEYMLSGKKSDIYAKAKKYLSEKWDANLPELGIKRNMKNYSAVYPVNLLKDTDASYFAEQVADIFSDEEKYRNAIVQNRRFNSKRFPRRNSFYKSSWQRVDSVWIFKQSKCISSIKYYR